VSGSTGTWRDRLRALKRDTYALVLAYRDRRTPWYAKLTALVVVAYAFSPIDLIPDFIPVLGLLDDLLLIPLGVVLVRRMVPTDVMEDCRVRADAAFENDKPVFWTAAVVVVILWAATAYFVYRLVAGPT
jgi:uncharacterized membrane protein YkvA (DUF1232 family)